MCSSVDQQAATHQCVLWYLPTSCNTLMCGLVLTNKLQHTNVCSGVDHEAAAKHQCVLWCWPSSCNTPMCALVLTNKLQHTNVCSGIDLQVVTQRCVLWCWPTSCNTPMCALVLTNKLQTPICALVLTYNLKCLSRESFVSSAKETLSCEPRSTVCGLLSAMDKTATKAGQFRGLTKVK